MLRAIFRLDMNRWVTRPLMQAVTLCALALHHRENPATAVASVFTLQLAYSVVFAVTETLVDMRLRARD